MLSPSQSLHYSPNKENEICSVAPQRGGPLTQHAGVNLCYFSAVGSRSGVQMLPGGGGRLCPCPRAEQDRALGLPRRSHLVFAHAER